MALPSDISLVTVRGNFLDMLGNPVAGTVTMTPTTSVYYPATSTQILPVPFRATVNGSFSLDVIAVDDEDFTPINWAYRVEVRVGSYTRNFNMQPRLADVDEGIDILLVAPSDPTQVFSTYVRSVNGTTPDSSGNVQISTSVGSVDWESIENRPSLFPPTAHTHQYSSLTGIPTSFPPAAHTHSWDQVADKPTVFPPAGHTHSIAEIQDLAQAIPDVSDTVRFVLYSNGWAQRPAGARPVFFLGGTADTPPPDLSDADGDVWISGS